MTPVFLDFVRVVVNGDIDQVSRRLAGSPALAMTSSDVGATRQEASTFFFADIAHSRSKVMELGAFSISLAVKDLEASRKFYEKFGFTVFGGDPSQNWLILKNGNHVIGL